MADNNQQPQPQSQFLGGGPKFNRAGAQPPDVEVSAVPVAPPPNRTRTWLIVIALLVLVGVLYGLEAGLLGPNGLTQKSGQGGISPTQHTTGPETDPGS
jgi:hypothetical protein